MYASYAIAPKVSTNYYGIATLQQSVTMPFVGGWDLGVDRARWYRLLLDT